MMKRQCPGLPNILGDVIAVPLRWLGWKACSAFARGWQWLVMVISTFESKPELTVQIHSFQVQGETVMGFPFSVWVTQIPAEYCVFQMLTQVSKMRQKNSWETGSNSSLDRLGVWRQGGVQKRLIFHQKLLCMKNVNCLCVRVLKIGFMKSEILMSGFSVLLLQYFVVVPCIPGLHVCPQHTICLPCHLCYTTQELQFVATLWFLESFRINWNQKLSKCIVLRQ